ncbi:BMC domain-containing protein [Ferviditalea candida]|uniref:BMC domain-containing protein n=1 Tax=Ferviditalea candida TaxID=3108399 RepID=A0ABU5ZGG4_9BACL|nr:BMC domain-containing protein [Paenibacillaceae bacterium T2]
MKTESYALGMIETRGLPALIAAADAAAKAASVRVAAYEQADAGIVTVYILGDVASVTAAVGAGAAAARETGELLHSHVIPRPDREVPMLIRQFRNSAPEGKDEKRAGEKQEPSHLQAYSVTELRRLARGFAGFPLAGREISRANKQQLLSLLEPYAKKGGMPHDKA